MNRAHVALITPSAARERRLPGGMTEREPSIGVLTLAALIRPRFPTSFIDLDYLFQEAGGSSERAFEAAVDSAVCLRPDVVGLGSISGTYPTTIRLAEALARKLPEARIVLGGPQASVVDVASMEAFPFIDAIIRGEAEVSFPEVLDAWDRGESLAGIPGVTFRDGPKIQRNPNAPVILDLDRVPLPAFDLYVGIEDRRTLALEIGRGCPFACRFCSTNDFFRRRFRLKSTACVIGQMRSLAAMYPQVTAFELVHDMFTVDRGKVVEFCSQLIGLKSPFQWSCSARTDCVDSELLALMKEAGCRSIFFGIEAGSERLQAMIDKGLNMMEARRMVREADRLGMRTTASLITGYPGETMDDFRQTVAFLTDTLTCVNVNHQLHILAPLAETPLTTQYRNELFLDEYWFENAWSGLDQDPADQALITAHPRIFPNFYAFPCPIDRSFLRGACCFLLHAAVRCPGLLLALLCSEDDLLAVYERWHQVKDHRPPEYFGQWGFVQDLIGFLKREYEWSQEPGLRITSRFYGALADSACRESGREDGKRLAVSLRRGVHVLTVEGDILRVLESLYRGERPEGAHLDRTVTVVVRQHEGERAYIAEIPPLAFTILNHLAQNSKFDEIVFDIEQRQFRIGNLHSEEIVSLSLESLQRKGYIYIPADLPYGTA